MFHPTKEDRRGLRIKSQKRRNRMARPRMEFKLAGCGSSASGKFPAVPRQRVGGLESAHLRYSRCLALNKLMDDDKLIVDWLRGREKCRSAVIPHGAFGRSSSD
jgi:hypothetical protein